MMNRKHLAGLVLILAIIWLTMIFCLAIVYTVLPPLDKLTISGLGIAMIQFLLAGSILLIWLYSWNMLVRFYFHKNMNMTRAESRKPSKRKY
jgi:hypothetical protein